MDLLDWNNLKPHEVEYMRAVIAILKSMPELKDLEAEDVQRAKLSTAVSATSALAFSAAHIQASYKGQASFHSRHEHPVATLESNRGAETSSSGFLRQGDRRCLVGDCKIRPRGMMY
jgi:hypothetical protein